MNRILNTKNTCLFYAGVALALLPLLIYRDFTPDNELRYLSIVDEAIRDKNFFAFYNHGIPYADKPPLYFWFMMLCRLIAGKHCMWLYAMGSLLSAFGVIAVMDRWSKSIPLSRIVLMTSAYFLGAAVILRMDMLMCFFIVLSLYTFWKMYEGKGSVHDKWLFPIYLFLALFTKGPLGILIPLFSILVFLAAKKEIGSFTKFWGWRTWGVLLALCAVWFAGVYADGGKEYLDNLLFHQTIDRAVDSFHHKRPFYYYFIAVWYILAPWSLYVIGCMVADLRHFNRLRELQKFFITLSVTTLILLSCLSSKLQIYLLPALPFMVYSSMMSLPKYKDCFLTKLAFEFPLVVFVLVLPALGVADHYLLADIEVPVLVYNAAALLSGGGLLALIMLWRKGVYSAIKTASVALLAALFVAGFALPDFNSYMGYGTFCKKAKAVSTRQNIDKIYTWRIKRPENMDVYLGKDVIILDDDSLPPVSVMTDGILLIPSKEATEFGGTSRCDVGNRSIVWIKR